MNLLPGYAALNNNKFIFIVNFNDLIERGHINDNATLAEGLTAVPDDASLHYALGLALVRAQRTAEGFTHIERAAARAPDNMRFVYTYAVSLHSAGKAREAIAVLEKALRRRPNDRDLLIALATFNRDQGALEPALRYAERMAAQYPDDPEAQRLVAQLRARSPR